MLTIQVPGTITFKGTRNSEVHTVSHLDVIVSDLPPYRIVTLSVVSNRYLDTVVFHVPKDVCEYFKAGDNVDVFSDELTLSAETADVLNQFVNGSLVPIETNTIEYGAPAIYYATLDWFLDDVDRKVVSIWVKDGLWLQSCEEEFLFTFYPSSEKPYFQAGLNEDDFCDMLDIPQESADVLSQLVEKVYQ